MNIRPSRPERRTPALQRPPGRRRVERRRPPNRREWIAGIITLLILAVALAAAALAIWAVIHDPASLSTPVDDVL